MLYMGLQNHKEPGCSLSTIKVINLYEATGLDYDVLILAVNKDFKILPINKHLHMIGKAACLNANLYSLGKCPVYSKIFPMDISFVCFVFDFWLCFGIIQFYARFR
jgi:hypothetical protein